MRVEVTHKGQSPEILVSGIYVRAFCVFIFLSKFNVLVRWVYLYSSQLFSHDTPVGDQRYARPANQLAMSWFHPRTQTSHFVKGQYYLQASLIHAANLAVHPFKIVLHRNEFPLHLAFLASHLIDLSFVPYNLMLHPVEMALHPLDFVLHPVEMAFPYAKSLLCARGACIVSALLSNLSQRAIRAREGSQGICRGA